ncbi:MFS family permease [Sphingomonas sp. UYAg733]
MSSAQHAPCTPDNRWAELFSGRRAIYTLILAGSVALHAVNIYVATTVMPDIVADIGGFDYYAWGTTLFVLASIIAAALSTQLLHGVGARNGYALAAVTFVAGTLGVALAPTMPVLLAGRFIQGLGGGLLYALAYGVIRLVFPERMWSRAIGFISATWGVSTLTGPAIGGIFAELSAWRWAFFSLIPLAVLFGGLAFTSLPHAGKRDDGSVAVPVWQLALLTASVLTLSAGSLAKTSFGAVSSVIGAALLFVLLIVVEARARARLVPRGGISFSTPLGALYATAGLLVLGMQPEIYVPYFLQVLHGQSPLLAGYLAALMAIGWTLGSILSSGWSTHRARSAIIAGPTLCLAGLALLAAFLPHRGGGDWLVLGPVCVGLVIVGLGIGFAWPHLVTSVFKAAPEGEQELAAGAVTTVQLLASALGAAAAGVVANMAGIASPGADGTLAAFWLPTTFAAAPALVLAMLLARRRTARASRPDPISEGILK